MLAVAGAAYGGYRVVSSGSSSTPKTLPPCPTASAKPPAAQRELLTVRNATLTTGLAADVARELRQRHFRVGKVGNTLFRGKGIATVQYSADRRQSAQLVAAQFDGATMTEVSGSGVLEVDIGPRYHSLVPADQAQAADHTILASVSPSPTSSPSPCASRATTSNGSTP